MTLEAGSQVPDLVLESTTKKNVRLRDLNRTIIYFYPKDDTPGCTVQACRFRDSYDEIRSRGWDVYGVSTDTIASHERFIEKHKLTFELLSDPDHVAAEAFGVWVKRSMFGNTFFSAKRSTFAIENGVIAQAWARADPTSNAHDIIEWIDARSV